MSVPCLFDLEKLGAGSYGQIWKAKLFQTGESRALKVFENDQAGDMRREAQILNLVQGSPHVVKFFGYYDGTRSKLPIYEKLQSDLFLLLEYVNGSNLWQIKDQGRVENMDWVCKQCFDGLEYIHSKGVVHRDLKGGNIMIEKTRGDNYRVVIVDFGLSCVDPTLATMETPCETDHAGTYEYLSPEIASSLIAKTAAPFRVEYANDVWGMGITLLEFFGSLVAGGGIKELFPGHVWTSEPQDVYQNLQGVVSYNQFRYGIANAKFILSAAIPQQPDLPAVFQEKFFQYIEALVRCFEPIETRPRAFELQNSMNELEFLF